jgi:CubicO group peptidase (beta-lactamase class C family)
MISSVTSLQSDLIQSAMDHEGIPGIAVAIVRSGEIIAAGGYGYRKLNQQLPMTPDTVTPICSLTKSMTGIAIMQLVEQSKISLDEPVRTYLPNLMISDAETTGKITPRVLLNHKSGMGRTGHQPPMWTEKISPYKDRADLVSRLASIQIQTPPNTAWSYCNEGFVTLGHLIETVSNTPLEEYFETRIFQPVGMDDTFTTFDGWRASTDRAHLYERSEKGPTEAFLPAKYGTYLSTGGISSTVLDLARYQIASMDYANSPLLGAGSLEQMQTISMPFGDTGTGYGMGWQIRWHGSRKVVSHGGGLAGVSTHSLVVPSEGIGVVVLANQGEANVSLLAEQLAATLLDEPIFFSDPQKPPTINTRFAVPLNSLTQYPGVYQFEESTIEIKGGNNSITFVHDIPDGGTEEANLVGIGDSLFMAGDGVRSYGTLVYFVRDGNNGTVNSLLVGGHQYWRS